MYSGISDDEGGLGGFDGYDIDDGEECDDDEDVEMEKEDDEVRAAARTLRHDPAPHPNLTMPYACATPLLAPSCPLQALTLKDLAGQGLPTAAQAAAVVVDDEPEDDDDDEDAEMDDVRVGAATPTEDMLSEDAAEDGAPKPNEEAPPEKKTTSGKAADGSRGCSMPKLQSVPKRARRRRG